MITSPSYFNIRHLAKYKYIFLKCLEKSKANIIPRRIYTRYFINGKAMNVCVCVFRYMDKGKYPTFSSFISNYTPC